MKLVVLSADPQGPVVRHRVRAVEGHLRAAGFDRIDVAAIPKRVRDRFALFRSLRDADAVLLQRKLFTAAEVGLLRACARRLVFDFDDAVMFRDPSRHRPHSRVRRLRFRRTVRAADLVTAGNAYLLGLAEEDGKDTPVLLAPTPVDTGRYLPGDAPPHGFRIGWIGSRSTRPFLSLLDPALADVARRRPDATLCVMADEPPPPPGGLRLEFTPWSEDSEVAFLQSLHVGVMPLPDDPFSRGKCGFKLLQYMSCGLAVVASPVGVNVAMLANGETGLGARTAGEWGDALLALSENPGRRAALGAAGRKLAVSTWSTQVLGAPFAEALARCARGGARP